ncbi:hypothetical protein [Maritimibacter sp. DP1N21-5]|uniref:hypothetical protein n=1 Tax=Maritimibacter sp. DP1N21-5 TaxID=2836867 RepID=UPI001C470792|nr:hypothetical protein [Maritimibacter sp. DP1N21-5]MBV7409176.1 hypothetical protein [Maritimibacter sp. DP1N21-5]
MRNAALMLGIIGGLIAMLVGFFNFGYTEVLDSNAEINRFANDVWGPLENRELLRVASFLAPLLALVGGAMAKVRALWGGVLMLAAGALTYYAFGFGVFTMFPIGFCIAGGILAIAAGKPDEPVAHF